MLIRKRNDNAPVAALSFPESELYPGGLDSSSKMRSEKTRSFDQSIRCTTKGYFPDHLTINIPRK